MRTQLTGNQVIDGGVQRHDLDAVTAGSAVVRRLIAGTNVTLVSTGPDSGTGDVTINSAGLPLFIQDAAPTPTPTTKYLWIQTNYLVAGGLTIWIENGL